MHYEMYRDEKGEWRWRLRAANGEILASGESYKEKMACYSALVLVKSSADAPVQIEGESPAAGKH